MAITHVRNAQGRMKVKVKPLDIKVVKPAQPVRRDITDRADLNNLSNYKLVRTL